MKNQPKTQGNTTKEVPTTTKNTSKKPRLLSVMTGYNQHTSPILPRKLIEAGFQYVTTIE